MQENQLGLPAKEDLVGSASHLTNLRCSPTSPITAEDEDCPRAVRRFRFDRVSGFCLGGLVLGTAGCIMGACLPYDHPVAVTVSALWWGIYGGCFGANVGALLGLWAERTPALPFQEPREWASILMEKWPCSPSRKTDREPSAALRPPDLTEW
jgi:hypothetical protein